MKKQIVTMAALACVLATAAGCGKTNPEADYPELADSVPRDPNKPIQEPPPAPVIPQAVKEEPKSYLDSALFQIEMANNLNFVEGKESSYLVKPTSLIANATFKLVATEKPEGATFAPVKANEPMGAYKLTWKPAVGTLVNQEIYRPFDFVVAVEVTGGSDKAAVERLKRIAVPKEDVKIQLFKTSEQPKIKQNDLKTRKITEIPEGEKIEFTVTVEDKGAYAGHPPRLFRDDEEVRNNDFTFVPGSRYVRIVKSKSEGNGIYVFTAIFDSHGIEIPAGKSSVLARFKMMALSPSGLVTPEEAIEIKVVKKVEAPAPAQAPVEAEKPATVTPAASVAAEMSGAAPSEAQAEKATATAEGAAEGTTSTAETAPAVTAEKSEATSKAAAAATKTVATTKAKAASKTAVKKPTTKKPAATKTTSAKAKTTATAQGAKK